MTDKLDLIKNSDEESIEDMELGLLLSTAFYSFTQYLNEYFEEAGLTLTQARILFTLGIKDNVSVDYLAEKKSLRFSPERTFLHHAISICYRTFSHNNLDIRR